MGNEHGPQLCEPYLAASKLHLRPFTTVDHKEFFPDFNNLGRRVMIEGRQCRPTTKDMNSEWSHIVALPAFGNQGSFFANECAYFTLL